MKCIDPWLTKNKRVCPICKRKVFAHDEPRQDSDSDSDTDDTTPLIRSGARGTQGGTFEVRLWLFCLPQILYGLFFRFKAKIRYVELPARYPKCWRDAISLPALTTTVSTPKLKSDKVLPVPQPIPVSSNVTVQIGFICLDNFFYSIDSSSSSSVYEVPVQELVSSAECHESGHADNSPVNI